ncbi:hypothetical protein E3O25_08915 [Cryobacterium sp. TMT1-3]|uniref:acetamidase/formamidase family protein n=1 Tax=Cryobacterium sp. TMT1-3 TaxID=1259237 RepID=UPI001069DEF9|nr:acetamidase/formamidase family protein [Cryobacterium sp. TMT1-3]TFC27928.1 hypothetical protein E3O25_08915 [Cryobacterium sp. TMT1-3]
MREFDEQIYRLSPGLAPSFTVEPGEVFACLTQDASGNQIGEGVRHADLDPSRVFAVNGPIEIAGVKAGDAVGVEIRAIDPAEWGHTWTRPGLGVGAPPESHVRRLAARHPLIEWGTGAPIAVTPRLHIGTLGLLPRVETEPRHLGGYGGNLDSVLCAVGSTVWITAQVDGGGLFVGDVHAAMGDAEVCGTGIEVAARLELCVRTRTDWAPTFATIRREEKTWIVVDGDDFDEALRRGVAECTRLLAAHFGMPHNDAYLAVGLLLEVRVCQVVNSRRSLALSLTGGADAALAPALL